ncbi:helix-turn-helix domain-containing protein [Halopiger xanaduensis]|uniref:helix-turn-helix domain-containing protein n=1 Tax=Halopiger xanaduensis TaxID=387343 RepID=UPI001FDF4FB9|nr:helix-turn-helix domain-containing protein [Halopiger xanaduensis]
MEDLLTDRQLDIFRSALEAGYYDVRQRHFARDAVSELGVTMTRVRLPTGSPKNTPTSLSAADDLHGSVGLSRTVSGIRPPDPAERA